MTTPHDLVFLFDVDNTLLDNDRVQADLAAHLTEAYGDNSCKLYWDIFEQLRGELGYADYLGALERFRLVKMHDPRVLRMSSWLVDYPFADRLYSGALRAISHVQQWGAAVIVSDGDAVFQPRKIERSGLWAAFEDRVLIYIHKERELAEVERLYPAKRYVMIDDKLRILNAVKAGVGRARHHSLPETRPLRAGPGCSRSLSASRHSLGPSPRFDQLRLGCIRHHARETAP